MMVVRLVASRLVRFVDVVREASIRGDDVAGWFRRFRWYGELVGGGEGGHGCESLKSFVDLSEVVGEVAEGITECLVKCIEKETGHYW